MIDVDRMHAGDEKLARTMKELLDDVKERHGVAPARKRHDDAHGIERPEREFVPLDAEKRFGRIGERVVDELRQTLGERLRAARRTCGLGLFWERRTWADWRDSKGREKQSRHCTAAGDTNGKKSKKGTSSMEKRAFLRRAGR